MQSLIAVRQKAKVFDKNAEGEVHVFEMAVTEGGCVARRQSSMVETQLSRGMALERC